MEIIVAHQQGRVPVTVFHVKGDIDHSSYEQLQDTAQQAYTAGTRNLLLDLAEVPYVSSAGIRALTHIFNMLRADAPQESDAAMRKGLRDGTFHSPHLKLLQPTPRVASVLKTMGADMLVEIHTDLQAAIASF